MILSDLGLNGLLGSKQLVIEPLTDDTVQQNGVDLRLSNEIAKRVSKPTEVIDAVSGEEIQRSFEIERSKEECFVLLPLNHYLLTTQERIRMPSNIVGFCGLRSTFARLGFISPLTIIDAGFEGTLTIGIFYCGSSPIRLPVGCRFLHVVFAKLETRVSKPYNGQYQNQEGIKLPRSVV